MGKLFSSSYSFLK